MPTVDKLIEEIYDLKMERAAIAREINEMENLIISVTERVEELLSHGPNARGSKDWRDKYARARDKRRAVRDQIADKRHAIHKIEAKIDTLALQVEYSEDVGA